jgi:hypothetical protein
MRKPADLLRTIAAAKTVGNSGRLRDVPRNEMINLAREVCEHLGIDYSTASLVPARVDKPDSAPKHQNYRKPRG